MCVTMQDNTKRKICEAHKTLETVYVDVQGSAGSSGSARLTIRVAQPAWHVAGSMTR